MEAVRDNKYYTYADCADCGEDGVRYELIDGAAYTMPAPSTAHNRICRRLLRQIEDFLEGKPCEVFNAPYDVRLNAAGDEDDTVIRPDPLVVCDKSKIDAKGCNGAPDMVIEISSPSTAGRDFILKYQKYLKAGVREYWIVDPGTKMVQVNIFEGGGYAPRAYTAADNVPVGILEGCAVNLPDVFSSI